MVAVQSASPGNISMLLPVPDPPVITSPALGKLYYEIQTKKLMKIYLTIS